MGKGPVIGASELVIIERQTQQGVKKREGFAYSKVEIAKPKRASIAGKKRKAKAHASNPDEGKLIDL